MAREELGIRECWEGAKKVLIMLMWLVVGGVWEVCLTLLSWTCRSVVSSLGPIDGRGTVKPAASLLPTAKRPLVPGLHCRPSRLAPVDVHELRCLTSVTWPAVLPKSVNSATSARLALLMGPTWAELSSA